jgi:hypothetical protein
VRWLDGFARMRFLPRNLGDLHTVLTRHLPDEMPVEASEGTGISAKTVGELRKLSSWPGGLVVETSRDFGHHVLKISRDSGRRN